LEKLGYVKRVHGGVVYKGREKDLAISVREYSKIKEKQRIAKKAITFIKEGDTVILDAGTTTMEIAKQLVEKKDITVVTNGLNIAVQLSQNTNLHVIMTGGEVRHSTQSL
ncbi:DeoR/GlpR family DNA-binding transcription regulator, partial [Pseudomonas sp. 2822-17]|uniref:DeoR/GlpR family DNA-binding transcription regulator n=1 Tax=Pseudomonas sp. 2822-17 TaxID=1712678 RepID=UPI00117B2472